MKLKHFEELVKTQCVHKSIQQLLRIALWLI